MDLALIWDRLVPGTQYEGIPGTPSFMWMDERPQPTMAEVEAEWEVIQAEEAKKAANAQAFENYSRLVALGYDHNGKTYNCDDAFTTDLVKMVMLTQLQPEEPVYLITRGGEVVSMSVDDFKAFAVALGYYAYTLRQAYWAAIK